MRNILMALTWAWVGCASVVMQAEAASPLTGAWTSSLEFGGQRLTLVLNVSYLDGEYTASVDSPDQGAMGIPADVIAIDDDSLRLAINSIGASLDVQLDAAELKGEWRQMNQSFPLVFERMTGDVKGLDRPQEPRGPFPYSSHAVEFDNPSSKIRLAGTLTVPLTGPIHGKVILVSGSGPQDRNEEIMGHKPFWVIADYLSRHGYAVLRYDDRGTAASEGRFEDAYIADFIQDALAGVELLHQRQDLQGLPVGIIGHSEGAFVAGKIASMTDRVDFVVMLAGPGIQGGALYREQVEAILTASGVAASDIEKRLELLDRYISLVIRTPITEDISKQLGDLVTPLAALDGVTDAATIDRLIEVYGGSTLRGVLKLDPAKDYANIRLPVLALNGDHDLQVLAQSNIDGLRAIFKANRHGQLTTKRFARLNHLFQTSATGNPSEYARISETFAPQVLEYMRNWMDNLPVVMKIKHDKH